MIAIATEPGKGGGLLSRLWVNLLKTAKHSSRSPILAGVALVMGTSCEDVSWPEPQDIRSLRVLGVRADPPTLTPGGSTQLSIICADGRGGSTESPECDVEIAWFSRCDNPPNNDPTQCFSGYARWARSLESPIADTPTSALPEGFGLGSLYTFAPPEGILSGQALVSGQSIRYGTSYVFFAVCAGDLIPVQTASDRLPVECRDRDNGERLDQRAFVVGFTTLYTYEGIQSHNPLLLAPKFDDVAIPSSCSAASPCPAGFECSTGAGCLPVVEHCREADVDDCPRHSLSFGLERASFSVFGVDGIALDSDSKSLWLDAFTNAGSLPDDASFALHAPSKPSGIQRTPSVFWQSPSTPTEQAHLWAVVRDSRGGLTVSEQRILVR